MKRPADIPEEVHALREELVGIFGDAQRDIQAMLATGAVTPYQEYRLKDQQAQLAGIMRSLKESTKGKATETVLPFYAKGVEASNIAMALQGLDVPSGDMGNQVHVRGVTAVAQKMAQDLGTATANMERTAKNLIRQTQQVALEERKVDALIAQGIARGETLQQTKSKLRKELEEAVGKGGLVQAGSRRYTPEAYAEMVVRTRTREAVTVGTINHGLEHGVTLYQISVHDSACPICVPKQGKVYSIVEDTRFPTLTDENRPPIHPHCEHTLVPYIPVPTEKGQEEMERLSELSKNPAPIAADQAGFNDAVRHSKKNGPGGISKPEAEKSRRRAEETAAKAQRRTRQLEKHQNRISELHLPEDPRNYVGWRDRAIEIMEEIEADEALEHKDRVSLASWVSKQQTEMVGRARGKTIHELRRIAKAAGVNNTHVATKEELVKILTTSNRFYVEEVGAALAEKAAAAASKRAATAAAKRRSPDDLSYINDTKEWREEFVKKATKEMEAVDDEWGGKIKALESRLAANEKRRTYFDDNWDELVGKGVDPSHEYNHLVDVFTEDFRALTALENQRDVAARKAQFKFLREPNGVKPTYDKAKTKKQYDEVADELLSWIPSDKLTPNEREWLNDFTVEYGVDNPDWAGSYSWHDHTIRMEESVKNPLKRQQTFAHEFGHHISATMHDVLLKSGQFYRQRTKGEAIHQIKGHHSWVVGREDRFRNYSAYAGYTNGNEAEGEEETFFEVISVGVEYVFRNPLLAAQKDPEWFDMVVGSIKRHGQTEPGGQFFWMDPGPE